jgi:hypothetical protein
MKRWIRFLFLLFVSISIGIISCNSNNDSSGRSENDIDAAREFIRAALEGKFDKARGYMLSDSINMQYMDAAERNYLKTDNETRSGYKTASINIHKVETLNDSTTIVVYSNSFKNDHDSLKILKLKGQWLVDLKYLYQHSVDSAGQ